MSNHLSGEKSLYLLQHAENPVDWYPWGPEALERARREDKPIFLSIGYMSCHWCHVMARESFESEETAEILNRDYVSVKVDREERPDLDALYMEACLALNGSGGWPMTLLLTPEGKPFFAATYLPPENRGRQMGLRPLLRAAALKWKRDRESLLRSAGELNDYLLRETPRVERTADEETLQACFSQLRDLYDGEYGGFGPAPKFPAPQQLLFLLRYGKLAERPEAREMAEKTLQQMARGGIYDQIGGGFARYSTDREWLAPHFEKTLYDNALLALCYTEAWQEGRFALYRRVAEETLDYCLRELRSPLGGFYSGQDADSQGEEGKYYLLSPSEVESVLGQVEGRHFCECYDITAEGNFHGKSIPNLLLNQRWNLVPEGYGEYRRALREYRASRCALETDKKLPTAWNGMLLMALSRAALAFDNPDYAQAARTLARYLLETAGGMEPERLQSLCYEEPSPRAYPAQLDDIVFAALGLLELYPLDFDPALLLQAERLAERLPTRFADPRGGYFRTDAGERDLPRRPRELYDGALPSGNTAAALLFERLYRLSGKAHWGEKAREQMDFLSAAMERTPIGGCFAWLGLLTEVFPSRELVCAAPAPTALLRSVQSRYAPELSLLLRRPEDDLLPAFAPFTADMEALEGKARYYPCSGGSCQMPFAE